jgi:hypothetical protein
LQDGGTSSFLAAFINLKKHSNHFQYFVSPSLCRQAEISMGINSAEKIMYQAGIEPLWLT